MLCRTAITLFLFLFTLFLHGQETEAEQVLLNRLDSVAGSAGIAAHFASLYRNTSARAIAYYRNSGSAERDLACRFMQAFAGYFFQSAENPTVNWQTYYSDSSRTVLQYQLLGMNAHINGDLWQTLYRHFSYEEFRTGRKILIRFQQALRKEFTLYYAEVIRKKGTGRTLHLLTAGLSRYIGQWKMLHWRKRQFRLAGRMFDKPDKAKLYLNRITRKKQGLDRLILRHF